MIRIKRVASTKDGTFGVIFRHDGVPFALTLERPWANNQKGKSCIPAGEYAVKRCKASPDYGFKDSPRFGNTFQVTNVPGRSHILFHKGNLDDDTRGCILIGEQYGFLRGHPAILASGPGFKEFLGIMATENGFILGITEHFDG